MTKITPDEFKVIAKYIYEISGITLESSKTYLVETRLGHLLEEHKCASYSEFYFKANGDKSGLISKNVIDAISTN
jgi:chemotaxis protein methyltransferase CheR